MAPKKDRKRKFINGICILIYLSGVLFFALPDLRGIANQIANFQVANEFKKEVSKLETTQKEDSSATKNETDHNADLDALLLKMQEYNQLIYVNGQSELKDPWSYEQSALDLEEYGVAEDVIGIITIPKMDIEVPIYQGATTGNMDKGAVLLGQTSFPIEGTNSNSVIAAHRGWRGNKLFREIEKLEPGDTLTIQNYWETLTYKVTDIRIIMPDDIDAVLIQPGKNMVTLLTCHPYTKTDRRYAVFCEKVEEEISESGNQDKDGRTEGEQDASVNAENAQLVREQAEAEDGALIRRDKIGRAVGYIAAAVLGIMIISVIRKKE